MFSSTEAFPTSNFDQSWDQRMSVGSAQQWLATEDTTNSYSSRRSSVGSPREQECSLTDEQYFKMAGLDPSTMTKEELRKHKNRASAARSRNRTRDRMEQLELLVAQLSAKNRQLQDAITNLQTQHMPPQPQRMGQYAMHY